MEFDIVFASEAEFQLAVNRRRIRNPGADSPPKFILDCRRFRTPGADSKHRFLAVAAH
jgi:hypothetical protein